MGLANSIADEDRNGSEICQSQLKGRHWLAYLANHRKLH